jgi:hypothetical protein
MSEENCRNFSLPNDSELFWIYAKTEIENTSIDVHRITADDTIITGKEVPEDVKRRIREYAVDKGIDVKFKISKTRDSWGRT